MNMNEEELKALARMSNGWHLLTPFPVQEAQLDIINSVIKAMRQGYMDYITVELQEFQGKIDFIQTTTQEPGYRVELKLTNQETKMYAMELATVEEVEKLFRSVLAEGVTPDLTGWEDITEMVFYPQLNGDEYEEAEESPLWYKNLQ